MKQWDSKLYDAKHGFVSGYGLDVVGLLDPKPNERILDLGCGTGTLAAEIAKAGASVVGLDSSPEMIAKAKAGFPDLEFIVGDGQDFWFEQKFDAVFSNAALHWMKKPEKVIACVWQALKHGGRFVAEFGGRGNVATIIRCVSEVLQECRGQSEPDLVNYFPSIGEYTPLLEAQGFRVTHAFHFDRSTPLEGEEGLRNWIKMFRSSALKNLSAEEEENFLSRIEKKAKPLLYKEGVWQADYRRLRLKAVKEN